MSLKERVYSVLIVSAAENFASSFSSLLTESKYMPVRIVSSISAAKRALSERAYDYVIINSPLHDDTGVRFAIDTCNRRGTIVLLFVRADLHDEIHNKVVGYGVFTLQKPTSKPTVVTALNWMSTRKNLLCANRGMEHIPSCGMCRWSSRRILQIGLSVGLLHLMVRTSIFIITAYFLIPERRKC